MFMKQYSKRGKIVTQLCWPSQCEDEASYESSAQRGPGSLQSTTSGTLQTPPLDQQICSVSHCKVETMFVLYFWHSIKILLKNCSILQCKIVIKDILLEQNKHSIGSC